MNTPHPNDTSRPLLPAALWLPLLLALIGWSLVFPAAAGERRARLTIELQLDGGSRWGDGNDGGRSTLNRHYRLVTTLRSDGEAMSVNTKAPDYAQQMMARAAGVQARVAEVQARQPAPDPAALAAAMQSRAAQLQQAQAACGGDRACLMRRLMPPAAAGVSADPALQARLVRHAGQAPAGAGADDGEDEARFLAYNGIDRCDARYEVKADERADGRYADVQGPVPWSEKRSAAGGLSADELRLLCLGFNLVLDTRTQTLSTDAGFALPEPPAVTVRSERGRSERSEGRLAGIGPVAQWVAERTRQAPRSGSAQATLPLTAADVHRHGGRGQAGGSVQARLSWKFEEL